MRDPLCGMNNLIEGIIVNKFNLTIVALALAVLSGCASTSGTLVGTSATSNSAFPYQPDAIPKMLWTNDD